MIQTNPSFLRSGEWVPTPHSPLPTLLNSTSTNTSYLPLPTPHSLERGVGTSLPNYKKTLEYTQRIATQYPHLCRLTSTILDFAKIDRLRFLFVPFS